MKIEICDHIKFTVLIEQMLPKLKIKLFIREKIFTVHIADKD